MLSQAELPTQVPLPTLPGEATQREVIEPGRALALADFAPPSLSAGERLIRFAYRMGVPGSALSTPFGKTARPRLLATVASPLPGSKVAGTALRAGHFLVMGAKTPIAQADFGGAARLSPPLERVVHSFAWLADLEACAPREQCLGVAERVLAALARCQPQAAFAAGQRRGLVARQCRHARAQLAGPRPADPVGHRQGAASPRSGRAGRYRPLARSQRLPRRRRPGGGGGVVRDRRRRAAAARWPRAPALWRGRADPCAGRTGGRRWRRAQPLAAGPDGSHRAAGAAARLLPRHPPRSPHDT